MSKKRAAGEGCIYRRTDGRWGGYATIRGHRRYVTGLTQKAVLQKLNELQTNQTRPGSIPTLALFMHDLLETTFKAEHRYGTWKFNETYWRNLIHGSDLGQMKLDKIRTTHIQRLIESIRLRYKPATVRRIGALISITLTHAVREEIIPANPAFNVRYPKNGQVQKRVLTADEAVSLATMDCSERLRDMLVLAVSTGLRRGEICGLRWEDVDFETRFLSVRQQIVIIEKLAKVQEPKTKTAIRDVFLTDQALAAIQRQAKRCEYVFSTENGTPIRPDNFSRDFRSLRSKVGLDNVRLHDLRASFISLLFQEGVDPRTVQELVGHSNARTTLEAYARSNKTVKEIAVRRLSERLSKASDDSLEVEPDSESK